MNSVFDVLNFFIWFILIHLVDYFCRQTFCELDGVLEFIIIYFSNLPNLDGSDINFLSILLQKTPSVITGMNSDCMTSSKCLSCVDVPEIIHM